MEAEPAEVDENQTLQDNATASSDDDETKATNYVPPSHQERLAKVKRIRDGATKEK